MPVEVPLPASQEAGTAAIVNGMGSPT